MNKSRNKFNQLLIKSTINTNKQKDNYKNNSKKP